MKRNRKQYILFIILTIAVGLFSRSNIVHDLIHSFLGDFLYALMFFFIIGFIFPTLESFKVVLISSACCFSIEVLQLYQADWMNYIRSYALGGLILGYGFLWSDIASYTLGGFTGFLLEHYWLNKKSAD